MKRSRFAVIALAVLLLLGVGLGLNFYFNQSNRPTPRQGNDATQEASGLADIARTNGSTTPGSTGGTAPANTGASSRNGDPAAPTGSNTAAENPPKQPPQPEALNKPPAERPVSELLESMGKPQGTDPGTLTEFKFWVSGIVVDEFGAGLAGATVNGGVSQSMYDDDDNPENKSKKLDDRVPTEKERYSKRVREPRHMAGLSATTTSDASGAFSLAFIGKLYDKLTAELGVSAALENYLCLDSYRVTPRNGQHVADVRLRMRLVGSVSGHVKDPAGNTIANALVTLTAWQPKPEPAPRGRTPEPVKDPNREPPASAPLPATYRATTGQDGRYVINGVATGRYEIVAFINSHHPLDTPVEVEAIAGRQVVAPDVVLKPAPGVRATLVDDSNQPIQTAFALELFADRPERGRGKVIGNSAAYSDEKGVVLFERVKAGTYLARIKNYLYEDMDLVRIEIKDGEVADMGTITLRANPPTPQPTAEEIERQQQEARRRELEEIERKRNGRNK